MKKQTKKRGYHWFRMLTKKQKKQYRENVKNNEIITVNFEKYINYNKTTSGTALGFIYRAFNPYNTHQGNKYWYKVIQRLENN